MFLLYKGRVEIPSDLSGIVYIDISGGIEASAEQIRRETAGLTNRAQMCVGIEICRVSVPIDLDDDEINSAPYSLAVSFAVEIGRFASNRKRSFS